MERERGKLRGPEGTQNPKITLPEEKNPKARHEKVYIKKDLPQMALREWYHCIVCTYMHKKLRVLQARARRCTYCTRT